MRLFWSHAKYSFHASARDGDNVHTDSVLTERADAAITSELVWAYVECMEHIASIVRDLEYWIES